MDYDDVGFVKAQDGTRLFYGIRGKGPVVILCDGIGCEGWVWEHIQAPLAERYTVVHWNYRGHGRSGYPQERERVSVPDLADDLQCLVQQLELEDTVCIGHSMGTQVCLEYFRREPERTKGLVLACGSYGKVTETFHGNDMLKQVLPTIIDKLNSYRGLARVFWERIPPGLGFMVAKLSKEIDGLAVREEDFRRYIENMRLMDPEVFFEMLKHAGEHSAEDLLPEINVPTLVIAADQDTFTPPELSRYMGETIPGARFESIRGGTHAAPAEQPHSFRDVILPFLEEVFA